VRGSSFSTTFNLSFKLAALSQLTPVVSDEPVGERLRLLRFGGDHPQEVVSFPQLHIGLSRGQRSTKRGLAAASGFLNCNNLSAVVRNEWE
jgi:hypothetical protein